MSNTLPWEVEDETMSILSQDLMEKILALSLCEKNFTERPVAEAAEEHFSLQDFAPVIMKLLEVDSNLGAVHARVSPKMSEETFWRHYYLRIQYLRKLSGVEGVEAQKAASQIDQDDVIFRYESSTTTGDTSDRGEDSASSLVDKSDDETKVDVQNKPSSDELEAAKRREAELLLQREVILF